MQSIRAGSNGQHVLLIVVGFLAARVALAFAFAWPW
jgi:hypothetical protein